MMKRTILSLSLVVGLAYAPQAQVMMIGPADSLSYISSPLDLDSLFYWFAADVGVTDSLGGAIATDEGVGTWQDQSGNGYHVTQTTNTDRPVYKATGGPGGKPCIQFDGSDDFFTSSTHLWESDDFSIFIVMKYASATRNVSEWVLNKIQWLIFGSNAAAGYKDQLALLNSSYKFDRWQPKTATFHILYFDVVAGTNTSNNYKDGAAQTRTQNDSSAGMNNGTDALLIGKNAAEFFQGSISEIIVFSRQVTDAERTSLENYLNKKYDLY